MKKKVENIILLVIGIIFLLLGIGAIVNNLYQSDLVPILWLCYIGMILIGIGILTRNSLLVVSQLNIMAIPSIFWSVDFLYGIFNQGTTLFGIVDYYFVSEPLIGKIISSQHIFTLPLSLFALYLIKVKRSDIWKISFIQLIIVYIFTRLVTDPERNVNCVFKPCANFIPETGYLITWFVLVFLLVYITNFLINRMKFLYK